MAIVNLQILTEKYRKKENYGNGRIFAFFNILWNAEKLAADHWHLEKKMVLTGFMTV